MARQMWPYAAVLQYAVRGTYEQGAAWGYAASIKGLPVPVFLALAANDYADRMRKRHAREDRRRAREATR